MADDPDAKPRPGEFVIGTEMAAAIDAEERRVHAAGPGRSPLPTGSYDAWLGQQELFDPVELPLDLALRDFVGVFRGLGADEREAVRCGVGLDGAYTLLTFARRAAVFGLRTPGTGAVIDGLTACAAIELERTDWRDVLVALALLHHAAVRSSDEAGRLFADAAEMGEPGLRTLIDGFLARSAAERDLRDAWGWVEVEAPGGPGLLQWGFEDWTPRLELPSCALAIAGILSADAYQARDVTLATTMPEVWLADAGDAALGSIIGAARGTVTIHGRLRPAATPDHASQQLTVFLLEAGDAGAAARLETMAGSERPGREPLGARLGVAAGALFALVIARSWVDGVDSFEDTRTLVRFEASLRKVLEQFAGPVSEGHGRAR